MLRKRDYSTSDVIDQLNAGYPIEMSRSKSFFYKDQIQKTKNLQEVLQVIQKILADSLYPNEFCFNELIKKLIKFNEYKTLFDIYKIAYVKGITNFFIYSEMINAIGNNLDQHGLTKDMAIVEIEKILSDAERDYHDYKMKPGDRIFIGNNAVKAAGQLGMPYKAIAFYEKIKEYANDFTYVEIMKAIGNSLGQCGLTKDVAVEEIKKILIDIERSCREHKLSSDKRILVWNNAIKVAGNLAAPRTAIAFYEKIKKSANSFTYVETLTAIGNNPKQDQLEKLGSIQEIEKILNDAENACYNNKITFRDWLIVANNAIKSDGNLAAPRNAIAFYDKVKNHADVFTYVEIITAIGDNLNRGGLEKDAAIAKIEEILVSAEKDYYDQKIRIDEWIIIGTNVIKAAGNLRAPIKAIGFYKKIKEYANDFICSETLTAIGNNLNHDELTKDMAIAEIENILDQVEKDYCERKINFGKRILIWANAIKAAGNIGAPIKAIAFYKDIKNCVSDFIYSETITAIGSNLNNDQLTKNMAIAEIENILAQVEKDYRKHKLNLSKRIIIWNNAIKAVGKLTGPCTAIALYEKIKEHADVFTYVETLTAIGNNLDQDGLTKKAAIQEINIILSNLETAYLQNKIKSQDHIFAWNYGIKAAGTLGSPCKATEWYEKIKMYANSYTYTETIKAIGDNLSQDELTQDMVITKIKKVLDDAERECPRKINSNELFLIKTAAIDTFMLNGNTDEAKKIYIQLGLNLKVVQLDNSYYKINLHLLSIGSAKIALSEFVNSISSSFDVNIVCGKNEKNKKQEESSLKIIVKKTLEEIKEFYDVLEITDNYHGNEGRIYVHFGNKITNHSSQTKRKRNEVDDELLLKRRKLNTLKEARVEFKKICEARLKFFRQKVSDLVVNRGLEKESNDKLVSHNDLVNATNNIINQMKR